jgi:hypothetical protein
MNDINYIFNSIISNSIFFVAVYILINIGTFIFNKIQNKNYPYSIYTFVYSIIVLGILNLFSSQIKSFIGNLTFDPILIFQIFMIVSLLFFNYIDSKNRKTN